MTTFKRLRTGSTPWLILALLILAATAVLWASSAAANSPPATPASVTVTRSADSLYIDWEAIPGATKYHVTYSSDNGNSWASAGDSLTGDSVSFGNTDPAKTYVAAVRAGNAHGWSGWRNSPPIQPDGSTAPPAAPTPISISREDGTLTASWSEPASASKYHVTYSSNNRGSWSAPSCGDNCSNGVTLNNVDNAKTYIVAVRAGNDTGWSGWSHSAPSGPFGPVAPPTPGPFTVTRADGTLTATWDAVSGADKYHINYSSDNKNSWQTYSSNYNQITITRNVDNSKTYYIAVRAGKNVSNGTLWSGWRNSAASGPIGQPPATPASVSVSRGNGTLSVSGYGVSDATRYHVNYSSDGGNSWSVASNNHTGTTITISGVNNAKAYIVAVRAGNTNGWSGWRNSAASGPSHPPAAPASVTLNRPCEKFTVTWAPSAGATSYDVNTSSTNRKSWIRALSDVEHNVWVFAVWSKDKSYHAAVRARNAAGVSGWTDSAVAHQPSCEVSNLRAFSYTDHGTAGVSIATTWDAAEGASGYNVNYRADGGQWKRIASNVSATNHEGTVATTGGYTVAVQSIHGGATSFWRNTRVGAWLTAGSITGGEATLTLAGHSGDWYVKKMSPSPAGTCSSAISGTTHNLSNLLGSTTYSYGAYRDSTCTTELAGTNFATGASTAVPSAPAAPALTTGNAQLTAAWIAPAHNGSAITGYNVRYRTTGATGWSIPPALYPAYNPGQLVGVKSSNGSAGQAFDLGNVSLSGLTVTKLTGNVYRLSEAVSGLRLKLSARNANTPNTALTYYARYASTAPTASTMNTHGTELWGHTVNKAFYVDGDAWTPPLPANTYFWITTTANGSTDSFRPGVEAETSVASTGRSLTITGLTNGTGYDAQVRAFNANGLGAWSPTATVKAGLPARASAPTLLSSNQQLTATWAAVSGNGSAITDYDLRYSSNSGSTWTDVEMDSTANTARSFTITNLTNDTAYIVQARATNTHGDGLWSPSSTSVKAGAPDAPAAPTLASGNATLTATWTAPADNGSAITSYDVQYSTDGSTWSSANVTITLSTRTAVITGLANDTAYQVRVRATNARATGAWSPSATDKPGRPPAPSAPSLTAGSRQLTVAWTAPTANGLSITDYDVQYRKSSATDWSEWAHTGTAVTATITGLDGAATYEVRVRAESSAGDGPWSATTSLSTNAGLPDAPATPTLLLSSGQITVQWTAPYNGGSALTGFKAQYKESSASTWTPHTFSSTGSTTQTAIGRLTNGTSYDFQVRATNAQGDGPWTTKASGTAGGPAQVTATVARGNGQLTVSWTAPADNGNAINDYDVRYRQVGTGAWTRIFDGGSVGLTHVTGNDSAGSTDPIDFGNLGAGITREALGTNQGLYKVPNAIDEMRIYLQANGGAAFTMRTSASKPTNLSTGTVLASTTSNSFTTWVGPIAANGYFWASPTSGSSTYSLRYRRIHHIDLATTATTYTVTGLTNNTAYEVQVRAENSQGSGQWSAAVSATPTAPTLTVTEIKAKEAKLNLSNYFGSGDWYYKADKAPHTDCQGPVTASTTQKHVTGLSPGTAYVYTAYSDSGCSTTLATASAFTTEISLDVYNVTTHAVTLRLHGWSGDWWHKRTAGTPTNNTCNTVNAGGEGGYGDLRHSSQYTVKAYSKSGCNAADEIAERVFNTPVPGGGNNP